MTPTESAFSRLETLLPTLTNFAKKNWTEADTRSKLIDPLFGTVLGWDECDIRREEPVASGFADYVFMNRDFTHMHVEAKRANPRWNLQTKESPRELQLSGPHLLGNKSLKKHLIQAQSYAAGLGSPYAILTNGTQIIVFRSIHIGHDWKRHFALCWHSLEDIKTGFGELYALLAKENVVDGALRVRFEGHSSLRELHRAADFVSTADNEFVRNPFWSRISAVVNPLLTDDPSDTALAERIIKNCYVTTPLSDETDKTIDALLRDTPGQTLTEAQVLDLRPGMRGNTAFGVRLEKDVKESRRPATYILTGGVGSGKTTFLRRYAAIVGRDLVASRCVWLAIDFLPVGSLEDSQRGEELRRFAFKALRDSLRMTPQYPNDGTEIRKLFQTEVTDARKTKLFGVPKDDPVAIAGINGLVDELWKDDQLVVTRVLQRVTHLSDRRPVVVFDNTDQLGEPAQEAIFLLAQAVAADCSALSIVALREEKFFAAYRRGVFDAFGERRFHIGSPDLASVVRKRLEYAIEEYERQSAATPGANDSAKRDVGQLLRCLIRSTTSSNGNIVRYLACVSNGDMRYALAAFRDFVSSGNTDVGKIQRVVREHGGYTVPFHEFAKSAILGSRRFFQASSSHIVNVFRCSNALGSSHLTALRVLARLSAAQGAASPHGEGFLSTETLLNEWTTMFGRTDDLTARSEELVLRGLVETEPPRQTDLRKALAARISAAGAYYWRYLVRSFAYLDLVYFDTPLADRNLARKFGSIANTTEMQVRFDRVRDYLDYLADCERADLTHQVDESSMETSLLIPQVRAQIEEEFDWIRRKLKNPDLE